MKSQLDIPPGERRNVFLEVAQGYTGAPVLMPATVIRGKLEGPTVAVLAALHGDEINGTGIVRCLILDEGLTLKKGTLILVPVVNIPGFERHSRYLPDRRDLNRCFPGKESGSFSSRYARFVYDRIVTRCDFIVDLHTAAVRRTNFPNVRGDLSDPATRRLAESLGCEILINAKGPQGSLRRSATEAGHPTVVLEAGEVWKVEPLIANYGCRAVFNLLRKLEMMDGKPTAPEVQTRLGRTKWIRAQVGGMLQFHVAPGQIVKKGQPIATNTNLLGVEQNQLLSPVSGIVIGMTTLPFVTPGDPVCHVGVARMRTQQKQNMTGKKGSLRARLRKDLSTSIDVTDPE